MRFSYWILVLFLAIGCIHKEDPAPQKIKFATLEIVNGDHQSGTSGNFLNDTLVLAVKSKLANLKVSDFEILAEMKMGNGKIESYNFQWTGSSKIVSADDKGIFEARWSLGCDKANQVLAFYLFHRDSCQVQAILNGSCIPIDSVTFSATASTPSGWNRSCGIDGTDRYNTKIHKFNEQIFAVSQGSLYKAVKSETLSWEKLENLPVTDIYDFGFNSKGWLYLLTDNHGLYLSKDLHTWTATSQGILDPRYPIGLLVEDSVVFASFYFDGLYRLRIAESFWKKLLINGIYWEEYHFPTRHPNGNLYTVDKWDTYWVSTNSGDIWNNIPLEYKYSNYQTEDLKINSSGLIYIGSGDASLAILSPDTYTGQVYSYYQWNASSQFVDNIIFDGNDTYYLVNFTPNPGIYSSKNGWQKVDIGFNKPINQFVIDAEHKFLLGTYEGIYYYKD